MMIQFHPAGSTSGRSASLDTPAPDRLGDAVVLELGLDDLPIGETRLARVHGHRVCVARTDAGVFAVDHACPHEGYGLTQGSLDGDLLTCAWHNWKFDVTTGACTLGEEDVPSHDVEVGADGAIAVRLRRRDPAADRTRLLASLERGLSKEYVGQIARDTARLLEIGVEPAEIVAIGVEWGAPRGEYGWGHAIAALTDCLAMVELFDSDQRAIPLVQGLSFVAHDERGRPARPLPEPAVPEESTVEVFVDAVEREDLDRAQAALLGALRRGASSAEMLSWFVEATAAHLLSYGHGTIYTHKAFELLAEIGWDHAETVLGHLVTSIVTSTREDTLPYFRPFGRELDAVDLDRLAASSPLVAQDDAAVTAACTDLRVALLGRDRGAAARAAVRAIETATLDQVLDVVVAVVSERLLRHDTVVEFDLDDDFGWLDITHGITYAHAARYLRHASASGDTVRPAPVGVGLVRTVLFCAFLANWTGRHEWHAQVGERARTSLDEQLADARSCDDESSRRAALREIGIGLQRRSLDDVHTAPIHVMHAVKTSRAAHLEAERVGRGDVLAATARYFDGPRQERGVRAATHRSIEFVGGRLQR